MNNPIIERFAYTDMGTFGSLIMPDGDRIYTVERPWLNNTPNISCIPNGNYKCRPRFYYRGGYEAVEILNVKDRKYIMIHIGNTIHDSSGCVLTASKLGCLKGIWAGLNSSYAFKRFMEVFGHSEFSLTIKNVIGGINEKYKIDYFGS